MFATRAESSSHSSSGPTDTSALSRHLLELLQRNELLSSRVDELVRTGSWINTVLFIALNAGDVSPPERSRQSDSRSAALCLSLIVCSPCYLFCYSYR